MTLILPWVNYRKILRDFSLNLLMGEFYITCKIIPVHVFSYINLYLYMGKFYIRSKFLHKIFPYNSHPLMKYQGDV